MSRYLTLEQFRAQFRVVDPQEQMEWELTHHCEI